MRTWQLARKALVCGEKSDTLLIREEQKIQLGLVLPRDEMKPRFGLLRACEFTMKDLYTFDTDPETAQATYRSGIATE